MGNARFRPRGDTAANWTAANPTLALREMALELDTGKWKVGDGATAWNSLAYFGSGGAAGVSSFNTRTGAVTLTSGDVTGVLGFTPMRGSNNLSEVASAATARKNIAALGYLTTRTVIAAITGQSAGQCVVLTEAGRHGEFVWDSSNLSAQVTADPNQGIYIAPASDTSGASGAWVRKYDGAVNVKWFGATGDGTTDDSAAFAAAVGFLYLDAGGGDGDYYHASQELFVPAGHYYQGSTTLDVRHSFVLRGAGGLGNGVYATKLRWAADTTGIRVQAYNTSGNNTVDGTPKGSGGWFHLRDLALRGGYTSQAATPDNVQYAGIHHKQRIFIDNVTVENFQGPGLYDSQLTSANTNLSKVNNFVSNGNLDGRFTAGGGDNNVCAFRGCSYEFNRRYGVNEHSFIGNIEYDAHSNGNGVTAENDGVVCGAAIVSYSGRRFGVVPGQEAGASTNAPPASATDNTWWYYIEDGGPVSGRPAWFSGMLVSGGGAYATWGSGFNVFVGCYVESGEAFYNGSPNTVVVGNTAAWSVRGGVAIKSYFGAFATNNGIAILDPSNSGVPSIDFYGKDGSKHYGQIYVSNVGGDLVVNGFGATRLRVNGASVLDATSGGVAVTGSLSLSGSLSHSGSLALTGATGVKLQYNGADQLTIASGSATFAGTVAGSNLSGTNTGDETSSTILTKLSGASGGGTTNFLRADGTWAAPPGGGGGGTTTNALTMNSGGAGAASGSTFDGSAARTISYNTIGAAPQGAATASGLTMATARLLGRTTASTGAIEEISAGATLSLSAGALGVAKVPNAVTFTNTGGAAAGTTFDGSAAKTIDYSTLGALPSASPTVASGKLTTVASATGGAGLNLPHGAAPTSPANGDVWTTTTALFARINGATVQMATGTGTVTGTNTGDQTTVSGQAGFVANALTINNGGSGAASGSTFNGSTAVTLSYNSIGAAPLASPTFTGKVTTAASATGGAGFNLPHGAAPTTPANGDFWTTTAGIFARINGATVQAATGSGTATGTNTGDQTISITGDVTASGSTGALSATVTKINGTSLAGLATGILKNTTTTGVPSIAVAADFPTLNQNTTGSAATLTTSRNFSISGGGITASAVGFNGSAAVTLSASVDAAHITLARMANLAANSIIGNNTGSSATPLALTGTQVTAMLDAFGGANGTTGGSKGLVPAPAATDNTKFLRGDGTWQTVSGSGGTTTNALTINNSGSGDASGSTFDGSAAKTISYNSIGAAPTASPTFTGTMTAATITASGVVTGTSGLRAGGVSFTQNTDGGTYIQAALAPVGTNRDLVFQFSPSGTSTTSVMEFYADSGFTSTTRHIFKNAGGTLKIGGDAASLDIQFIRSNTAVATLNGTGLSLTGTISASNIGTAAAKNLSVGTSAPASPSVGDLWVDTN